MSKKEKHDTKQEEKNLQIPHSPGKENRKTNTAKQETTTPKNIPRWFANEHIRGWVLIGTTILLAAFTAWMAWKTHDLANQTAKTIPLLWKADSIANEGLKLSKQNVDSSNVYTRRSIEIAESSLKVNRFSADTIKKFTKMDLRAFIGFAGVDSLIMNIGEPLRIDIKFKNIGKTPAYNVREAGYRVFRKGEPNQFDIDTLKKTFQKCSPIHPGMEPIFTVESIWSPTQKNIADIMDGSWNLYVFKLINYNDVFGDKHFTMVCLKYFPEVRTFIPFPNYNDGN